MMKYINRQSLISSSISSSSFSCRRICVGGISMMNTHHRKMSTAAKSPSTAEVNEAIKKSSAPTFPVVLAHGLLGFDRLGPFDYFMNVKGALEAAGVKVEITVVPPTKSIEDRAKRLKEQIIVATEKYQTKVHVIAHSMGGLDTRFMASHLDGHKYIRSITTLATPHRGSYVAEWGIQNIGVKWKLINLLKFLGIPIEAFLQLTPQYCNEVLNPNTPDHEDISYFSYGAARPLKPYHAMYFFGQLLQRTEGDNDGLVSLTSAKWGEYLGTCTCDHMEIINWSPFFDASKIYLGITDFLSKHEGEIVRNNQSSSPSSPSSSTPSPLPDKQNDNNSNIQNKQEAA
eukprot:TRINITY_DN3921_c3_g2_i1.p1 TRINITY_DN3921_c3_g2~~TRINITY_DN3921_c3_g2_i1.p1  ORF type:complete len:343 (+),score=82.97 TRINITY_DN3921_c3_g2_i1:36-1064(+)